MAVFSKLYELTTARNSASALVAVAVVWTLARKASANQKRRYLRALPELLQSLYLPRPIPVLVLLSVGIHTDKCVISGLLSVWIRTAVCASIHHTIHTLSLTLNLTLTLNL